LPTPPFLKIHTELKRLYPDTQAFLHYRDPFGFLCAVILSAQCTDARVNLVVPNLWAKYPTPQKLANAKTQDVEKIIQSTGFYHNKAKNLIGCAKVLLEDFGGVIPKDIDEFVKIPGVGRKTANVVLGEIYGLTQGITVDTHVARLSFRLGFTKYHDPFHIEKDLMKIVPKADWLTFPHRLIQHGRTVCDARKPLCGACTLARWCPRQGIPKVG
jgi:endonuclease-3